MKKALIVGINYVGTGYDLRGCLNDASNMHAMLQQYKFDEIELLLEEKATTSGIKAALTRLTQGAMPGDVLVFHFSGHGSQVPNTIETDGYDEIICPFDLDWTTRYITDDYLKGVFNSVPNGVNVTVILDSCHSGTSLDQRSLMTSRYITAGGTREAPAEIKGRYLPPPAAVQAVIDQRASSTFSQDDLRRDVDVSAVLIAASKDSQLSADAKIDGIYQGAGTYSLIQGVTSFPTTNYRDLVASMNQYMTTHGYDQSPQLNGPTTLYKQKVFEPWDFMMEPNVPDEAPDAEDDFIPVAPPVVAPTPEKKDKTSMYVIIAFVVFIIAIVAYNMAG